MCESNDVGGLRGALLYQWTEAAQSWGPPLREGGVPAMQILKEVNSYLEGCSYFVDFSPSAVDTLMYRSLYATLANLSSSERRQIPCVCRWFNHVQQDASLRREHPLINFSSSFVTPVGISAPVGY